MDLHVNEISSSNDTIVVHKTSGNIVITIPRNTYTLSELASVIDSRLRDDGAGCESMLGYVKNGSEKELYRVLFVVKDEDITHLSGSFIDGINQFDYLKVVSSFEVDGKISIGSLKVYSNIKKIKIIETTANEWVLTKTGIDNIWTVTLNTKDANNNMESLIEYNGKLLLDTIVKSYSMYTIEQYDANDTLLFSKKNVEYSYDSRNSSSIPTNPTNPTDPTNPTVRVPIPSIKQETVFDLGYSFGSPSGSTLLNTVNTYNYYDVSDVIGRGIIKELVYADTGSTSTRIKFVAKNRENIVLWASKDIAKTSEGFVLKNISIDIDEPFVLGVVFETSKVSSIKAHNASGAKYYAYSVKFDNSLRRNANISLTNKIEISDRKIPVKAIIGDRTKLRRGDYSISTTIEGSSIADGNIDTAHYVFDGAKLPVSSNNKWFSTGTTKSARGTSYIGYNFPTEKHIRKIRMIGGFIPDILVQRSVNGNYWENVTEFQLIDAPNSTGTVDNPLWLEMELPESYSAKMWRVANNAEGGFSAVYALEMYEEQDYYVPSASYELDYGYFVGAAPTRTAMIPNGNGNTLVLDDVITLGVLEEIKMKNYEMNLNYVYFFTVDEYNQIQWISNLVNRVGEDLDLTNIHMNIQSDFKLGIFIPESGKNLKYYKTGEKSSFWDWDYNYPNYLYGSNSIGNLTIGKVVNLYTTPDSKIKQSALPIKIKMM